MTYSFSQSLLDDYIDGELPEDTRREVERLLQSHPEHAQDVQSSRQLKALLKNLDRHEPPPEYWAELQELIMARTVQQSGASQPVTRTPAKDEVRQSFFRSLVSVAAGLALFVSALVLGNSGPIEVRRSDPAPMSYASLPELVAQANTEEEKVFTTSQQRRLSGGILLVGPAGLLGRLSGLTGINSLE